MGLLRETGPGFRSDPLQRSLCDSQVRCPHARRQRAVRRRARQSWSNRFAIASCMPRPPTFSNGCRRKRSCKTCSTTPSASREMPGVAAIVNNRAITLRELAEECIDRHGTEVLEGTINRRLLEQGLRRKKLTVTDADLNAEVARAAKAMGKVRQAESSRHPRLDRHGRERPGDHRGHVLPRRRLAVGGAEEARRRRAGHAARHAAGLRGQLWSAGANAG